MKTPSGFSFAGVNAGIKANRKDLALIHSDTPCAAAGCFTVNRAKAAPVIDAEGRLPTSGIRALIINSGNANALTGQVGAEDVSSVKGALAKAMGLSERAILTASTGMIGVRLPVHLIAGALPALLGSLRPEPQNAAEAMMTTDTRIKIASRQVGVSGTEVTLAGLCKGSGMIAPELATMIAVVVTDLAITPEALGAVLRGAVQTTFNCITVDDDMSTNDSVFALANGRAGNALVTESSPDLAVFMAALTDLCRELAMEIAADGEGATKLVEISVAHAPTAAIARDLAKAVAGSSLVKAAIFGADPNWGRILAAIGARAGARGYTVAPEGARVSIDGVCVYDAGPLAHDVAALRAKMRTPKVEVQVDLGGEQGERATAWGCDLSYDYVKINADYSSLLVSSPEGRVAKDDRLTNYSSAFKTSLLVGALSYISRFAGKRCVIKYGGAAMVKESLKKSFCEDINLLRHVGLRPIVVHGGGPEITQTLEKLGSKSEFVDGVRVTNISDVKVVEMVLTGAINTGLVTLLNQEGGHAVGVSGKDGAFLRVRKLIPEDGRDLGQVGEITSINQGFLSMLLEEKYVPVISPIGIGEDGQSYNINADTVAAEVAMAMSAAKLIYLTDVPGILKKGELLEELTALDLERLLQDETISGGMRAKVRAILKAVGSGVEKVHIIDGRVPHSLIAELFTDRGVGTLIRCAQRSENEE